VGTIVYGATKITIHFDDRVLAHLQVVIGAKFRRRETMFFSWKDDPALGDGRSSIWLSTSIPLMISYTLPDRVELNREWLEILSLSANSAQGLVLVDEPGGSPVRASSSVVGGPQNARDRARTLSGIEKQMAMAEKRR
jgi:hypothetical protein